MRGVKIYLADGTYDGIVTISSNSSKISAICVEKDKIPNYENELDGPGIYLLLTRARRMRYSRHWASSKIRSREGVKKENG